ncbi:hypothetical protein EJ02DRAFT_205935 [Clathrospora elynae]|uniref:Uncharacterized protein n=1 Tax=Clathrospora elynae TaxID=706981 RepID=A0A6A5SNN8_9PLEO|nr:hypothetical protein EJ02DRAFT_205935 [Clathrospora elynae]
MAGGASVGSSRRDETGTSRGFQQRVAAISGCRGFEDQGCSGQEASLQRRGASQLSVCVETWERVGFVVEAGMMIEDVQFALSPVAPSFSRRERQQPSNQTPTLAVNTVNAPCTTPYAIGPSRQLYPLVVIVRDHCRRHRSELPFMKRVLLLLVDPASPGRNRVAGNSMDHNIIHNRAFLAA